MQSPDLLRHEVDFERLANYLKALAHPARLEILWRLRFPAKSADIVVRPRARTRASRRSAP